MSIAGISIVTAACPEGGVLPLAPGTPAGMAAHITRQRPLPVLRAGTELRDAPDGRPLFRVTGRALLPLRDGPHAWPCPLLTALAPHHDDGSPRAFFPARRGRSLAWITLSDKGAAGQRDDTGGPAIERCANVCPCATPRAFCCPMTPRLCGRCSWNWRWARAMI